MLNKLAVLVSLLFAVSFAIAQSNGTIKGKMLDKGNGEPLPFANVVLLRGGSQVTGTMTDFDGKFTFTALAPGKYEIQATYVGYQAIKVNDVVVNSGKITFVPDIKAASGSENLDEFVVIDYEIPLISKDQTSSGGIVTAEDIKKMPGRSATSIAATVGGVYEKDDGSNDLNVRGARSAGTDVYIDGIKVRGTQNLPKSSIEQVSVITGGIPAQYGDATGGIVNITTRGATKDWFGGIEFVSSGFKSGNNVIGLDKFGYNLVGFSLSGPIKTRKDSAGNKKDAIAGFFLSGEGTHELEPRPWYTGDWKVNDDKMAELNETPYIQNLGDEVGGVINSASYIKSSDLEKTPFRLNVSRKAFNLAGKIDITTSKTTNVAIGGSFDYRDFNREERETGTAFQLFNFQNNPQTIDRTWRVYGRFTQRFANSSEEENPSLVKDAFISFQVDYSNYNATTQSEEHKKNFTHYGYIGKFTTTRVDVIGDAPNIHYVQDPALHGQLDDTLRDGLGNPVFISGYFSQPNSILYSFEPGDINPILANYTSNYYDLFAGDPVNHFQTPVDVQGNAGLLNGDDPGDVYGLWSGMGRQRNGFSFQDQSQFRVSAQGSASIKDHAIQIGFEYEQRDDKFYSVNAKQLWQLGRQLTNTQIQELSYEQGTFTEIPGYNNSISAFILQNYYLEGEHNQFDKNLRKALGMDEKGVNWIDFDSYGPDVWDIGMFTPDELINNGGYVNNFGYDHTGEKLSGNPSLDDFFNKVDEDGNKLRENPGFRPIYVAGYIQDKFAFDDLVFNIGVRIDRYDANQAVLKDKYSLFPVKTVGEIDNIVTPANIGSDFVVYVSDPANPTITDITGYRNGDTWYNADGEEITDPSVLGSSGRPNPWLVDPNDNSVFDDLDGESFKDFEPQVNISPRIAFSFPISDEALFFAHYDVLTQRPEDNNRLDLISYLGFGDGGSSIFGGGINNPNLRAEKTIDYELGFQQKLDNYSSLKISSFYREMRDQIQYTQVIGAFPGNYFTFENKDFGTVKGLTLSYDLRTRGNISLRASYTLQFADGTGSSTTSSQNLVSSGNGNLRTLIPLNFDQRHRIVLSGDYRYKSGKSYNGPKVFGKDILQNTGLNVTARMGSGTPYTRQNKTIGSGVLFTTQGNSDQEGQTNASRLPFTTTIDMKLDRSIDIKWGKGEDDDKKEATLSIYIQALNVLNAGNIISVYSFTGNANDDGFLSSAEAQPFIVNQVDEQSYRDLYTTKAAYDGSNYALPRRIRLGIELNF
ncbi:MAG: hypothetical protein A3K10_08300 [Bacteroidetes bacterium RIFCSPLOWO2_12_FULL_31_6]|nr:MAG: hypothetical protein A3K10_08300 [Bacteroidetes bacterium RIFCSPLOWO2_12_FULL_31_6]